jgi:formylglycine-generating enzyme required for sulfatase activity
VLIAVSRNANAKWCIPSESEWYKAAYYQPAAPGGDSDNYWEYAMRTNSVPYSDQPPGATPDNTRVANFYQDDGLANGYDDGWAVPGSTVFSRSQNYLTDVGAYAASPSYYGTFDQGGNLYEWNEAVIGGSRGARGGSWADFAHNSPASYRVESEAFLQSQSVIGFRVAAVPAVPEPSSPLLILMASTGLLVRKRTLRYHSVPDEVVKSSK